MRVTADSLRARTAIVHGWFQGYHGAERVVEVMRSGLFAPDAPPDVYTFEAAKELLPQSSPPRSCASHGSPTYRASASGATTPVVGGTSCPTCRTTSAGSISTTTTS